MIDGSTGDVAAVVRDETAGHGADIVFNTVGSPYFAAANQAMAHGARQIFIATIDRAGAVRHFHLLSWTAQLLRRRFIGA